MIAIAAVAALIITLDPVAAFPTTNMPTAGGGSSAWWYETSNSDPLVTGLLSTTNMPVGGGGVETYWWEITNSDPLMTGIDVVLGAFPRISYA